MWWSEPSGSYCECWRSTNLTWFLCCDTPEPVPDPTNLDDWSSSLPLNLFEPKHEVADGSKPSPPASLEESQVESGGSTWARKAEPVEIPLVNGLEDSSVLGHWKLDGDVTGAFEDVDGATQITVLGDVVDTADNGSLSGLPAMTLMAWIRPDALPGDGETQTIAGNGTQGDGNPATDSYYLDLVGTGGQVVVRATHYVGGGGFTDAPAPGITVEQWSHLALTWDGAWIQIYIDGLPVKTSPLVGTMNSTPGHPFRIGSTNGYADSEFGGRIDDVVLANRSLSAAAIAAYARSKAQFGTSLVPGAQADYDDVRVTENDLIVTSEIVGVAPHSDHTAGLEGVVGYWKLDSSGIDATGGHDGDATGVSYAAGRFGSASSSLVATGAGEHVSVADHESLRGSVGTWEAWVLPTACNGNGHRFLSKNAEGFDDDLFLMLSSDCHFRLERNTAVGQTYDPIHSKALAPLGAWSHVAATWDGLEYRLYVDGLLQGSQPYTGPVNAAGQPLRIGGGDPFAPGDPFVGRIDEILVHDSAKSANYLYNRANGLPRVRFLASTDDATSTDGSYSWHDYTLHWDNPAAPFVAPVVGECVGLLSPCNGYVGLWSVASATRMVDRSTNALHGSVAGDAAVAPGLAGLALALDGVGEYVDVGSHVELDLSEFTVEAAVALDDLTKDSDRLVFKGDGGDANFHLDIEAGLAHAKFYEFQGGSVSVKSLSALTEGAWASVFMTWDGTTMRTWIDDGSIGEESTGSDPPQNTHSLFFGTLGPTSNNTNDFLTGRLSTVRITSRPLEPAERLRFPLASWSPGSVCVKGLCDAKEFSFTGADQSWNVPDGVTEIAVKLWGAGGGSSDDDAGGGGGFVSGTLAVTSGETLTLIVGELGFVGPAYGGGGGAEEAANPSRSGGGRSAIRRGNDELATAAGGGGVGNGRPGGAGGGLIGQQGGFDPTYSTALNGDSGGGGGQTSGGESKSGAGKQFQGGATAHHAEGGGGWYGGGAGKAGPEDAAGGGGSSYTGGLSDATNQAGAFSACGDTTDPDYGAGTCAANQHGRIVLRWKSP